MNKAETANTHTLLTLFWGFFKISATVVGGGYAIIAASEEYFVKRKQLITHDEMLDAVAITQSVPGIIACNSAIIIGNRIAGFRGAAAALAGAFLPPVIIITILGFLLSAVPDAVEHPRVQSAFKGVIAAVTAVVFASVLRTARGSKFTVQQMILTGLCAGGLLFFKLSPVFIMLGAITAGIVMTLFTRKKGKP